MIQLPTNLVHILSVRALVPPMGGAAAGAAAGMAAGPVGTVVGAVAGGVAGGLAGKAVAEQIDPSVEEHHWRNEYPLSDYYDPMIGYDEVGPAYQYGWESRAEYGDRKWDEVEPDLAHEWATHRGTSSLDWGRAQRRAMPGSASTRTSAGIRMKRRTRIQWKTAAKHAADAEVASILSQHRSISNKSSRHVFAAQEMQSLRVTRWITNGKLHMHAIRTAGSGTVWLVPAAAPPA